LKVKDFVADPVQKILVQMFDYYRSKDNTMAKSGQFIPFSNQVLGIKCGNDPYTFDTENTREVIDQVYKAFESMNISKSYKEIKKGRKKKKMFYLAKKDFFAYFNSGDDLLSDPES
jgi:hypothetical protein